MLINERLFGGSWAAGKKAGKTVEWSGRAFPPLPPPAYKSARPKGAAQKAAPGANACCGWFLLTQQAFYKLFHPVHSLFNVIDGRGVGNADKAFPVGAKGVAGGYYHALFRQ